MIWIDDLIFGVLTPLSAIVQLHCISWRPVLEVEEAGNTRREPPIMGKQLINFITCDCESIAPFCNLQIYEVGREPRPYW